METLDFIVKPLTDIKVHSKVLASRLENYMEKLVHFDQSGFMKGSLAADNIRHLMHIILETQQMDTPSAVLSLDAEKAFDRIE